MSKKKNKDQQSQPDPTPAKPASESMSMGAWDDAPPPIKRKFPGPPGASAPLRVALDRDAMAEITAHARESLECEVAGVLVGEICDDGNGKFVHARAAIRGESVRQGSAHVTYTQETWTKIHEKIDKDYSSYKIVGWYHTHPGFGVQFSAMDEFIQENFFGGPEMVALVTDPLSGEIGVLINRDGGLKYLSTIWVDGRAQTCFVKEEEPAAEPAAPVATGGSGDGAASTPAPARRASAGDGDVEARLNSMLLAIDDIREDYRRMQMVIFVFVCIAVIGALGWNIYTTRTAQRNPPKTLSVHDTPVMIDGREMKLGVEVKAWPIPEEMTASAQLKQQKAAIELQAKRQMASEIFRLYEDDRQSFESLREIYAEQYEQEKQRAAAAEEQRRKAREEAEAARRHRSPSPDSRQPRNQP